MYTDLLFETMMIQYGTKPFEFISSNVMKAFTASSAMIHAILYVYGEFVVPVLVGRFLRLLI
jgi:hypothetical protein